MNDFTNSQKTHCSDKFLFKKIFQFFYTSLKIKKCDKNFKLFKNFILYNINMLINLFLTLKFFEKL